MLLDGGRRISSGAVRDALAAGRPDEAADLLGYPWFVSGEVVHGDRRGRELGYPTANLRLDPGCGLRPGYRHGVGLRSMEERAVEIGGSCAIATAPQGGTHVHVRLPLPRP